MLQHKHMTYVEGFKYPAHLWPRRSKLKFVVLDTQIFTFMVFTFVAVIYHHVQSQFGMTFVFEYLLM